MKDKAKSKKKDKLIEYTIDSITESYGMTVSLGDYEFIRVDSAYTMRSTKVCKTQKELDAHVDEMRSIANSMAQKDVVGKVKSVNKKE